MKKSKKQQVVELLKKNTDGFTIIEISRILRISRNTAVAALAELKGAELVSIRPIGMAKLYRLKNGKIKY